MNNNVSATQKILYALENGQTFSVKQGQHRFGVKNISARISELRDAGHAIYTNTKNLVRGNGTFKVYRLGTPSTQVRAAARRARMTGRKSS